VKAALFLLAWVMASAAVAQTTFEGRFYLLPEWQHRKTVGASETVERFGAILTWPHTTGAGADQMQTIVTDAATLTNSASRTIDLTSVVNGFGDAVSFSSVRFLAVTASSDNLDPIDIGAAGATAFVNWIGGTNQTIRIRPGGAVAFVAPDATGYAVSTNGLLRFLNTGTNDAAYVAYIGGSE